MNTNKNLSTIIRFNTIKTGYGHWLITMEVDNPALLLSNLDEYWRYYDIENEPETLTLKHTTTNSRAIDGYDGFEQTLASECIRANNWDDSLFDLTSLKSKEE
jgi:hypothetical protein